MKKYRPLIGGIILILIITIIISHGYYDFARGSMLEMQVLMGVWFLVFGIMKLGDVRGFAEMFAKYDPLASKRPIYGLLYPFIEIGLGGMYLRDLMMRYSMLTNLIAIVITGITSVGIIIQLSRKSSLKCCCMGTKLTTPLGWPSLIEQGVMCLMAVQMLLMMGM